MKRIVMGLSFVLLLAAASLLPGRAQNTANATANPSEQPPTHNWAAGNPLKIALLEMVPSQYYDPFQSRQPAVWSGF